MGPRESRYVCVWLPSAPSLTALSFQRSTVSPLSPPLVRNDYCKPLSEPHVGIAQVTFPKGWTGQWEVHSFIKKRYAFFDAEGTRIEEDEEEDEPQDEYRCVMRVMCDVPTTDCPLDHRRAVETQVGMTAVHPPPCRYS